MNSRILVILAILMGLITTVIFVFSLSESSKEDSIDVAMKRVVVATKEIQVNEQLTSEMVTTKELPEAQVHDSSVTDVNFVVGKMATAQMEPGEVILTHRVQSKEEEAAVLSKKIAPGKRGVSIGVNIVQSVSNLVEAEDTIDVIHTLVTGNKPNEIIETKTIFKDIRVLAIGQKMTVREENDELVEYAAVTLEMTEEQAEKIVNAMTTGSLHLTLHSKIVSE
ncbi:Flp pilus assembly protein CpaB [Paenisporosarcina cavernae]|uniref:Flp pilus assembly protein CpaB n=1 Tax=Paenisporosarcina cavernae TaxID=2320858 RepID=A0A385YQ44_9BACL|nr:Flp pilus assembly protein CpaB [Paenisporosarcina cavernae]AYC28634.1 Flp pilus assembly protein CpaB [Paenisporosarcina cavernae]